MAFMISVEEKKYPRDEGYQDEHDYKATHLTDYDKRIMVKRIRQENIRWVGKRVVGWILLIIFLMIVLPSLLTNV